MHKLMQLYNDNSRREKRPMNIVHNGSEASLYIYDVIDQYWGVSAQSVIDAVAQAGDAQVLNVYINSPGGSVFEGRAIMAELARFNGKTIAHIDSLCASAATSVALSCNEVRMSEGAFFMIHNASGMAWGDKAALRETANLLEKVEGSIIADYVTATGKPVEQIAAWMDAETWFTAQEALDNGFIDSITPAKQSTDAKNTWNLASYANAPKELSAPPIENKQVEDQEAPLVQQSAAQSNANRLKLISAA